MDNTEQVKMKRTCVNIHNFMEAFLDIVPLQPEDLQLNINLRDSENDPGCLTLTWSVDGMQRRPISYPVSKLPELTRAFRQYRFKKLIITAKGGEDDQKVRKLEEALKPVDWYAFQLCVHTETHEVVFAFCRHLAPMAIELNVYKPKGNEPYKAENIHIRLAMYRGYRTCAFITNNSVYPPIGSSTDCLIENGGFPQEMRQNWSYSVVDSAPNNEKIEVVQGRYPGCSSGNNSNNEQLEL